MMTEIIIEELIEKDVEKKRFRYRITNADVRRSAN